MREGPLTTDLSGPKASAESLTPRSNLVVADAVDFRSIFFSSATALGAQGSILAGRKSCWYVVLACGIVREPNRHNHVHVLSVTLLPAHPTELNCRMDLASI